MKKYAHTPTYRKLPPPQLVALPRPETDLSLDKLIYEHVRKVYEANDYHKANTYRALGITKTRLYGYLLDMGLHTTAKGHWGKRWPKHIKRQAGRPVWGVR